MRVFKVAVAITDDGFFIESEYTYTVFIAGLHNLRQFIRTKTPQGIKVKSKRWFGRKVKKHEHLELIHPLFNSGMFDIREVNRTADNRKLANGAILLELPLKEIAL